MVGWIYSYTFYLYRPTLAIDYSAAHIYFFFLFNTINLLDAILLDAGAQLDECTASTVVRNCQQENAQTSRMYPPQLPPPFSFVCGTSSIDNPLPSAVLFPTPFGEKESR